MREMIASTRWSAWPGPWLSSGEPLGHLVGDGPAAPLGHLLRQAGDAQPLLPDDLALVGPDLAVDQPEQRALALAVAAQQADPLAPLDLPVDAVQQPGAAEGQADVSETQQRHGMISTSSVGSGAAGGPGARNEPRGGHRGRAILSLTNSGAAARRSGRRAAGRAAGRRARARGGSQTGLGCSYVSFPTGRRVACGPPSVVNWTRRARGETQGRGSLAEFLGTSLTQPDALIT